MIICREIELYHKEKTPSGWRRWDWTSGRLWETQRGTLRTNIQQHCEHVRIFSGIQKKKAVSAPHTIALPKHRTSNNVLIITFYFDAPEDTKTAENSLPQINSLSVHTGRRSHLIFLRIKPRDKARPSNIQSAVAFTWALPYFITAAHEK